MAHANARLTEFGRLLLVQRITELGWPTAAPDRTAALMPSPRPRCVGFWPLAVATARARIGWPSGSGWPARPSMECCVAMA
jgi:hypothetical protein